MNPDNTPVSPILPGAWLGMVGGGQLGRMFCFAAQAMGYRVAVLDPDETSPAGAVADRHLRAAYDDEAALTELARLCAAVSTEFENVPAASLDFLARTTFVSPAGRCVAVAQDRIAEKRFIASSGVPVAPHVVIESSDALTALDDAALEAVLPGILKTARMGYDGKGQVRVGNAAEVRAAHASLGGVPCVLEKRLPLKFEVSALIARGATGCSTVYPLAQNTHRNGVLSHTIVPAPDANATLVEQAQQAALQIADKLGYVGVLCVEFFILEDGTLVANEMAPRPHNSGHYTVDACATSQFEQQVRAMTGMPLGDTRQHSPAVMLNILGDVWFPVNAKGERPTAAVTPPWHEVAAMPEARLHLYGKEDARPGRKMGHVNFTAATLEHARAAARDCARLLHIPTS
ncbi:5-(carboxyamino)imidazole ribonucleotide synthase [Paraburkholderia caribensis]|jgi:5-(carboxyamino)imidazole ribonucleotide synthase|uniref:5-(carboxyamino)imidazole ribonucleotide synthase n=1 Tax=Paraburkholderia caribensis TaxID=75105 RepID=UPI0006D3D501|nr:5-(carboxyamino)imidazole ribonucleotide synthase [Paraburkholderia caribensis]ALP63896.1 phosphoribosylaminoimidazole carboxylase [Paraburkholderia caribensis]AMV41557.1 phosphoribosylaminoimidazole carboxylase [Paraburkholderia caribensis]AUT50843.1 5-(carboxyamino)imidazole ribonucleotide synthase [Paraburkholderia caribensis]MDR6379988.1 5-(carboxyamino)imidazole ribonucleotide synthase [Paraburkholderia caribensis]CAG9232500.1 N5-carboxyaminoimidazole ribonucleotide synthase [Paraburkh